MTTTIAREGDLMASEQDQRLSDRVARATEAAQAIHLDDGTILIVLDVFPIERKTELPAVTYKESFFSRLLRRPSKRRTTRIARRSIQG